MMNVIYILFSYLIGAISFGILISHIFSLPDPRTIGSKNPGATNVLRSGKKLAALFTLLGDALKGAFTVGLAQYFELPPLMLGLIAIATMIGHIFPIYYGFKGGKGVATAAGILFIFSWMLGLTVLAIWLGVFFIWHTNNHQCHIIFYATFIKSFSLACVIGVAGVRDAYSYKKDPNHLFV